MVSLIIPCYNGGGCIGRCLDSVLNQTDKDIELILVNDGSTDNTHAIIEQYRGRLEQTITHFIYMEQENQGVGAACNNALKKVTGKYLMLLDADDLIFPDSVFEQSKWLDEHPEHGFVRTNGYYVTEDNIDLCTRLFEVNEYMKNKEDVFDELFDAQTYVWPGSYMIRMEVIEKLYPHRDIYPSRSGQNMQFLTMAAYISKAGYIDKPLMKYVLGKETLSHFSTGNVLNREITALEGYEDIRRHLVKCFMPECEQEAWEKRIKKLYAGTRLNLAIKHGNKQLAREYYQVVKTLYNGKPDLGLQISYYKLINPPVYCILRICRRLRWMR